MQTFLPYADFMETALKLDTKRLGKQRVEAFQILRTLLGVTNGWKNHPAVKMWRGYEAALSSYGITMCREWLFRGYQDSLIARFPRSSLIVMPPWLGDERLHSSHRAALLKKLSAHYRRFGWTDKWEGYFWPSEEIK